LSLDLGAFQHPAGLCDIDYIRDKVLSQMCRCAGGGAALWRAHVIDGTTLNMLGRVEAACVMACMRRDGDGLAAAG
jgi:hypothetical protein